MQFAIPIRQRQNSPRGNRCAVPVRARYTLTTLREPTTTHTQPLTQILVASTSVVTHDPLVDTPNPPIARASASHLAPSAVDTLTPPTKHGIKVQIREDCLALLLNR
jgi:hypothetical protein